MIWSGGLIAAFVLRKGLPYRASLTFDNPQLNCYDCWFEINRIRLVYPEV